MAAKVSCDKCGRIGAPAGFARLRVSLTGPTFILYVEAHGYEAYDEQADVCVTCAVDILKPLGITVRQRS